MGYLPTLSYYEFFQYNCIVSWYFFSENDIDKIFYELLWTTISALLVLPSIFRLIKSNKVHIYLRVCLFIVDIHFIYGHHKFQVYMLIANKVVLETNLIWNNKFKLHSSCRESKLGRCSCLKSKWTPIFRLFIWEPGILKFDYTNINFIILQHFWKACFPRIWLVCRRNVWIASFSKVSSLSLNEWMNAHEQHLS